MIIAVIDERINVRTSSWLGEYLKYLYWVPKWGVWMVTVFSFDKEKLAAAENCATFLLRHFNSELLKPTVSNCNVFTEVILTLPGRC